jgi:hypothetical protein
MGNLALVIGVDRYPTAAANLRGAVGDAIDFASWLVREGGVAEQHLRLALSRHAGSAALPDLLGGDVYATEADADAILDGVEWLVEIARDLKPARLFFYFSGHGLSILHPDLSQADVLCAADHLPSRGNHALLLDSIVGRLKAVVATEQFVIIDACRSAREGSRINPETVSAYGDAAQPVPLQFIFKSTTQGDKAFEEERGAFTGAMLDALGRAEGGGTAKVRMPDGGYVVRWRRLTEKVAAQVAGKAADAERIQEPRVDGENSPLHDPIMAEIADAAVPRSRLIVAAAQETLPPGARVDLRFSDGFDSFTAPFAGAEATIELQQASYIVRGSAPERAATPAAIVELYEPECRHRIDFQAPGAERLTMTAMGSATRSGGGQIVIMCRDPLVRLSFETLDGRVIATGADRIETAAEPGAYVARAAGPEGRPARVARALDEHEALAIEIAPPRSTSPTMAAMLAKTGAGSRELVQPSPRLGWLAAAEPSTLAAIALAQAVAGVTGDKSEKLGIGTYWTRSGARTGVALIVIDEALRDPAPGAPSATLTLQDGGAEPAALSLLANPAFPSIHEAAIGLAEGQYWLDVGLSGADKAGFRLPCAVIPGYVSALIVHNGPDGAGRSFRYCLERRQPAAFVADKSVRPAEYLQRVAMASSLAIDEPVVCALLLGQWFEPVSAAIACYALGTLSPEQLGTWQQPLQELSRRLLSHAPALPDARLLAARAGSAPSFDGTGWPLVSDGLIGLPQGSAESDMQPPPIPHRIWSMWPVPEAIIL